MFLGVTAFLLLEVIPYAAYVRQQLPLPALSSFCLEKAGHNKHGVTHADLRHAVRAAVGAVIVILFVFCHRQLLSLQQFF